jgi:hypothetical protein
MNTMNNRDPKTESWEITESAIKDEGKTGKCIQHGLLVRQLQIKP